MKSGPKGAGRPCETFPEKYKSTALELWRDGKSIEEIRQMLLTLGHNVSIKAIQSTVAPPGQPAPAAPTITTKDLESPDFDWDTRAVVDDLIQDGRTPTQILSWLIAQGLTPSIDDVVDYYIRRQEALNRLGPIQIEKQRLEQHLRSTRSKLHEVWKNMPEDKRYSEKTFVALLGEHRYGQEMYLKELRGNNQTQEVQAEQANREIEQKLGLTEEDPKPEPASIPIEALN